MKKDGRVDEDKGNHKGKVDCCLFRDENRRGEKRRRRRKRRKEEEGRGRGKGIREDMEGELKDFFFFFFVVVVLQLRWKMGCVVIGWRWE